MRNLKKFLALVLAFMMAFSLMTTVSASSFKDDDDINSKYAEAVNTLTKLGVINGYEAEDGTSTFNPKGNITRAEVAAIIYRIVTGDVGDKNVHLYKGYKEFSDVAEDKWYAGYVNYCANNGLVKGVGGDRFAPSNNVTGYEALVMILRAMGYNNPAEFSSGDWKLKASGYGSKLEITKNISTGSLGGPATREMVAEIMFQAIQAPMVNYSPLLGYTTDLLVDASEINTQYGTAGAPAKLYAADVPNTLMYQTFKYVGKRTENVLGADDYGRPVIEWVKDLSTDTLANGGKYIPNYQTAYKTADETAKGTTADATYVTDATNSSPAKGIEPAALSVTMTPVKVYHNAVTECQFTKDVNGDNTIYYDNIKEWLNGGQVAARTAHLDVNHTQEGTIGAPGRTTEVYKDGSKTVAANGDGKSHDDFIIVYIDNILGVVTGVTKRTFDTAGNHVMQPATLTVKVNDNATKAVEVKEESDEEDFDYNVGDLVILNTWGFQEQTTLVAATIQNCIPVLENDFKYTDQAANDTFGVETVAKATTANVTVKGTLGPKNHKTGIETDSGNYMANVVYRASGVAATDANGQSTGTAYIQGDGSSTAFTATEITVPAVSPYNYGHKMENAAINNSYTVVLDHHGYVVGMTAAETGSDIGVITSTEPVRIGTGKWAIEAELLMMDGAKKTVRLLKDVSAVGGTAVSDGNKPLDWHFFSSQNEAETSIGNNATGGNERNLKAEAGVLVRIESFNKDGGTYYKVTETQDGKWKQFTGATAAAGANNKFGVETGVANTLYSSDVANNDTADTDYAANPNQVAADGTTAVNHNLDDKTKFIIAEVNWDYSLNTGNVGGYSDMDYTTYTGFKTIPTVESNATGHVMFQRIGNNVFVHPDDSKLAGPVPSLVYTLKNKDKIPDVDAYLVYATGTTYADYSVYKALKNGEPADLKVSNNNLSLVNSKIEGVMTNATAVLVTVNSYNTKGYATDVDVTALAGQKIALANGVAFDKNGVLAYDSAVLLGGTNPGEMVDPDAFLTVADDCKVVIVNLGTGSYYVRDLDTIMQYEKYDVDGDDTYELTDGHDFVYDLDEYGYVDCIYILD